MRADQFGKAANDSRLPLNQAELDSLISEPLYFTGQAQEQCEAVLAKINAVTQSHPAATSYNPETIR